MTKDQRVFKIFMTFLMIWRNSHDITYLFSTYYMSGSAFRTVTGLTSGGGTGVNRCRNHNLCVSSTEVSIMAGVSSPLQSY